MSSIIRDAVPTAAHRETHPSTQLHPPVIELRGISKSFGAACAVNDLSLGVEEGRIVVFLGASGCGKTTTLRLIAGLETPDRGEIFLAGQAVAGHGAWLPPEARKIGMVFQDYALFPHLTSAQNVAFPLNKMPHALREARVRDMLALVGLAHCADRFPHQLSGGEQQRVALARALAPAPSVVLLDEPFSNLDAALRRQMRAEVKRILQQAGATAIFVTHDQEEALSLADVVVMMRDGQIVQHGPPQEVYLNPISREVAEFLGEANFVSGEAVGDKVRCALGTLPLCKPMHGSVEVMIRPEALRLVPDEYGAAEVTSVRFFGHDQLISLRFVDASSLEARVWGSAEVALGERITVEVRGAVVAYPR